MTVFVVVEQVPHGGSPVGGVFQTRELANRYIQMCPRHMESALEIQEWDVQGDDYDFR